MAPKNGGKGGHTGKPVTGLAKWRQCMAGDRPWEKVRLITGMPLREISFCVIIYMSHFDLEPPDEPVLSFALFPFDFNPQSLLDPSLPTPEFHAARGSKGV